MASFVRKNYALSIAHISKLRSWSDRYGVSESEMLRRAIQSYDPEKEKISDLHESDVAEFVNDLTERLRSAWKAVEQSNARVDEMLTELNDPAKRAAIASEVQQEFVETPGFLDEVSDQISELGHLYFRDPKL